MEDAAVATLNIKNLPDVLYKKLRVRAKKQHRSISQEITHILSEAVESPEPLSILELQGLGKGHWENVDAVAHIAKERQSWD